MPKTASAKKKLRRAEVYARPKSTPAKLAIAPAPVTEKQVRGVKLKTVSTLTMAFALLCLGAFMAGRPSVTRTSIPAQTKPCWARA